MGVRSPFEVGAKRQSP